VIGLALCVAYGSFLSTSGSKIFGALAAGYLLTAFVFTQTLVLRKAPHLAARLSALDPIERLSDTGLPIVYANPLRYLEAAYYAPPALNNNLFYISDPAAALRYAGTDSPDRALLLLSRIAPLQVTSMHNFTAAHSHFLLVESGGFSWLPPELAIRRATVILRQASPDSKTYEVLVDRADNAISTVSPTPGQGAQALR
jgi:hypothetical protein